MIPSPIQEFIAALVKSSPLMATVLVLLLHAHPLHTAHNIVIKRKLDTFTFELVYEDGPAAGTPWVQPICNDYFADGENWLEEKGFAEGLILDEVNFIDAGHCWSLNPDNQASWFNRKDAHGNYVKKEKETQGQKQRQSSSPQTQAQQIDFRPLRRNRVAENFSDHPTAAFNPPPFSSPEKRII